MTETLRFIGKISTPWRTIEECPRNVDSAGPPCTLELDPGFEEGLRGLEAGDDILVLYWLDRGDRERLLQEQRGSGPVRGVFALRSPHRPNPIGAAVVRIESVEGRNVHVRGLDCLDGTALLDIKPAIGGECSAVGTASSFPHN